MTARQIVESIVSGDISNLRETFEEALSEKLAEHLEFRKIEVAKGLFTEETDATVTEDEKLADIVESMVEQDLNELTEEELEAVANLSEEEFEKLQDHYITEAQKKKDSLNRENKI